MLAALQELKEVSRKVTELEMFVDTGGMHAIIPEDILEMNLTNENGEVEENTPNSTPRPLKTEIQCPFPRCNGLGNVRPHLYASHRSLSDCPHYYSFRKTVLNKSGNNTVPILMDSNHREGGRGGSDSDSDSDSDASSEDSDSDVQIVSEKDYEWQNHLASVGRLPAAGKGSRLKVQLERAIAAVPKRRNFAKVKARLVQMEKSWKYRDASSNKRQMLQFVRMSGGAALVRF
jgi:hypothetical protein